MKIDIKNIASFYINMDKDKSKNKDMIQLGKDLSLNNYTRSTGTYIANHPKSGCANSHFNILKDIDGPTVILEDDCVIASGLTSFEVPDDADAIYLGLSNWGYLNNVSKLKNFNYKRHDVFQNVHKIDGMLATHAILYISKDYIDMSKRISRWSADNDVHVDQGLASIQKYFNVYALSSPIFYQHSNTDATNIKLKGISRA